MPREGVPYPERLLCSLRCELKNIWNALSGKLHSVNGIEGDGQGNITIISENAALTVNDYPLSNQIGLNLDPSQLPAADVNSVNGQTGVVVLTADDIPSDGSSDVQTDIDALKAADVTLQGNINAEATARQNADSALQTNINACYASIPGEVSSALASSPRISTIEYNLTQAENDIDALENTRLKITDVNQYAVGLTGNQDSILGFKAFKTGIVQPMGLRSANTAKSLICSLAVSGNINCIFDFAVSNKRSLNIGRFIVSISNDAVSSVSWIRGFSTGTARCNLGAYTDNGILYVTIAGTEGGSFNAVSALGAFSGDGYAQTPLFYPRPIVNVGSDYAEVLVS